MIAQLDPEYIKTRPLKTVVRLISYALFEGRPLTTKGRWINRFVFAAHSVFKKVTKYRSIDRPLFIVGSGRSGTTMLGTILSLHPQVAFLNEPKAMWHSIYEEEDLAGSYSSGRARVRLNSSDATPKVKGAAQSLFGVYSKIVRQKRIIDKYPELIFRVGFIKAIFPDAKFIFLARNGWDTSQSVIRWSERFGLTENGLKYNWWGIDNRKWNLLVDQIIGIDKDYHNLRNLISTFESQREMAMVEWIITMREGLRQMERFKSDILLVRYEDITKAPYEEINNILEFCELEKDERLLKYACRKIKPASWHPISKIDPALIPLFSETMVRLGYASVAK